jgi:hemolysin D
MNAPFKPDGGTPKRPRPYRSDQAFLPASLELLEMPPSPVRMWLISAICLFFGVALVWAWIGRIDIVASAHGKIEPEGRIKVVEPLMTGKILRIHARDGDQVRVGQVLIELDPTEAIAREAALKASLASYRAEAARRLAEVASARDPTSNRDKTPAVAIKWFPETDIPHAVEQRELQVFSGDMANLKAQLTSIEAQIQQKENHADHLKRTAEAQMSYIATLEDQAEMRKTLLDRQAGSKSDWLSALEKVKEEKVTLASEEADVADVFASRTVLEKELTKTREAFVADNLQRLHDAERQVSDLLEQTREAHAQVMHMTLRSPISGTVVGSIATTVGQVVTTGEELMRVVPAGSKLQITAYLANQDAGFVHLGQDVSVKVDAFPFTRYGTIPGKVIQISKDAVPGADALTAEADPTKPAGQNQARAGGSEPTQDLVYALTVELQKDAIMADGKETKLVTGMGVTAEITTGNRRIIDYLFSPLVEVASNAMRER